MFSVAARGGTQWQSKSEVFWGQDDTMIHDGTVSECTGPSSLELHSHLIRDD